MLHLLKVGLEILGGLALLSVLGTVIFVALLNRDYESGGNPFE